VAVWGIVEHDDPAMDRSGAPMKTRALGQSGAKIAAIGQGTWELERADEAEATRALHAGLELGLTHVDTAEMYGSGRVEELLGRALAGRRDEVFLASKVLPSNASRAGTLRACERSLRRLRTDHLDLYLLHWPGEHPLSETLAAFDELQRKGSIRHFGVSNFDERELAEAVRLAGPGRIACNQVLYHLGERGVEHAVLPACERMGVALVAYSPFGSGRFPSPGTKGGRVLAELATRLGATPRQVALAYLVRKECVVTIPKSARAEHVRENAGASGLELSAADLTEIERAFPLGAKPRTLPMI
jgi:diketogulonate reductase-like aldo/keto reductase